jgi:Ca2+-binding EF-hand superfamily protein
MSRRTSPRSKSAGPQRKGPSRPAPPVLQAESVNRILGRSLDEEVAELRKRLQTGYKSIRQVFRDWDEDGNGTIDAREFRQALPFLGITVEADVANTLFQTFDRDGSGEIDLREWHRLLRPGQDAKDASLDFLQGSAELDTNLSTEKLPEGRTNRLATRGGKLSAQAEANRLFGKASILDPNSDVPVLQQLRNAMGEKLVRVTDLWRLWDEDDSGFITRKEFRKALAMHGASRAQRLLPIGTRRSDPRGWIPVELGSP